MGDEEMSKKSGVINFKVMKERFEEKFGRVMRRVRLERGMTQLKFGKLIFGESGRSRANMVCKLEAGQRTLDIVEVERICRVLGLKFMWFLIREEEI